MRTSERRRPPASFRYSPLIAAFACVFSQAGLAAPTLLTVNAGGDSGATGTLRWALQSIIIDECMNPDGYDVVVSGGPFVVSVSSALPTVSCANVQIVGNDNITIQPLLSFYGGICGLQASPASGLTKISGVKVQNFSYSGLGAGMCGKLDASGNIVSGNGIGFSLTGGANISGNTISQNTVKGLYDSVGGSTISQNTINGNAGPGILGAGSMVVTGNLVHNNSQHGIEVGANALVTGNTVHSNAWDGIHAGDTAVVKGNTTYGHTSGTGIYATSGTVGGPLTADRNVSHGNTTGILLYSGIIENNYLGVLADGVTAAGNGEGINGSNATALTIKNNVISGNTFNGIEAYAPGTITIQGNKIGTNASGNAALGNGYGIDLSFSYGGQIDGNLIAGNLGGGITLYYGTVTISNNQVGGAGSLQNGGDGLEIAWATGGSVTNNVISGNSGRGLALYGSDDVVISGNKIGTDASGTVGVANGESGITAQDANGLSIIGNQISANGFYGGVVLEWVGALTLQGNLIGTAADGSSALSNNGPGVTIDSSMPVAQFNARDQGPKAAKVLGTNLLDGNTIAHNNGDGIFVSAGTGNVIRGGSIHSNTGDSIDIGALFMQDPDPSDGSAGANNHQNHPVITSAVEDSGETKVEFELNSTPNNSFEVQLYANAASNQRAGQVFLGSSLVTTNLSGVASGSAAFSGSFTNVTATATGPYGTSEFSMPRVTLVPSITPLPTTIPFGNVVVGNTATTATEILFQPTTGSAPYIIDSIVQSDTAPACPGSGTISVCTFGDFSCSNGGGIPVKPSCVPATPYAPTDPPTVACAITGLSFHPMVAGPQSTKLWICDNTATTPRAITFTGNGVPHVVTSSQSAHDFGTVSIGTQAVSPSIVVTNASSNPPATLGALTVPAPFTIASNTCGATLAAGASCNFAFAYAPSAIGTSTGTASMTVANGSPVTVALQGSAVAAPLGQLTLPSGVDLGSAVLASAPLQHAVTMQNTGNAPVTFNSITATAPFQLSHDCPASLAPSASCTATLTFDPLVYGTTTGQLTVDSTASGSPHVATLLATVSGVPYGISPSSSDYGSIPVGSSSTPRAFVISNNGDNAIPLSGVTVTGPFTLASNTCGTTLGPQSSCTAEVAFAPGQPGLAEGTVAAQIGLSGAPPATALLSGAGTQAPALALPSAIDFGALVLGTPAVSQSVEIRNTGNAVLTFTSSVSGPFALSGDCGLNLLPSAACNLVITFTPSAVGDFTGTLAVVSNAPGGSRSIPIGARVQPVPRPDIRVDVTNIGFGDRMIGTRSAPQRVTVTNVGGVLAQLGITPPTRDFIATSQCGATLAPGASCTTDVVFMPLAVGPRINRLQFTSDATGSPFTVDLIGRGCPPARPGRPPSCN